MDNPMLALIETLAVTWFTLEYLLRFKTSGRLNTVNLSLRFAGSPEKWKFLKDGMNIIDVVTSHPRHNKEHYEHHCSSLSHNSSTRFFFFTHQVNISIQTPISKCTFIGVSCGCESSCLIFLTFQTFQTSIIFSSFKLF